MSLWKGADSGVAFGEKLFRDCWCTWGELLPELNARGSMLAWSRRTDAKGDALARFDDISGAVFHAQILQISIWLSADCESSKKSRKIGSLFNNVKHIIVAYKIEKCSRRIVPQMFPSKIVVKKNAMTQQSQFFVHRSLIIFSNL